MTCDVLHAVRVQTDAVAGSDAVWVQQILTKKHRRYSVDIIHYLDDWWTVYRSIILFGLQLDAPNSYLFTYNTFIKILHMFRALPYSSSGGLRRNCIYMQPLVSSLSAGDCLVHRLRKNFLS